MAKALKTAGAISAVGIMLLAVFFHPAGSEVRSATETADAMQSAESGQKTAQAADRDGRISLFPSLNPETITAISVHTPERSFQFYVDGCGAVSVNGQQADSEIYMTLVSQISELPVNASGAFNPDSAQLLLTLTVCAGGVQHTARFYEDSDACEIARIVVGPEGEPEYGQTNGWRVGTLMMTCEGTRIQDERGNERPANFNTSTDDQP